MNTKSRRITLGTREWADSNVNCYFGCSNDCRYCYAKKMAIRFNKKTESTWKEMVPNIRNIEKDYRRRQGRIMFPTSHDITDESIDNCLIVLQKLVNSGNEILITSKPKLSCINEICEKIKNNKDLIQFRFTITSKDNKLLKFWEPNAPLLEERMSSLMFVNSYGFRTSISIEPFLDENPFELVEILKPYVTESIWIGKMNYIRVNNLSLYERNYYKEIRKINSRINLRAIVKKSKIYDENFLRIKDSIFNYLNKK